MRLGLPLIFLLGGMASCSATPVVAPHGALVLVIDTSKNCPVEALRSLEDAIGMAAQQLGVDDELAVLAFNSRSHWVIPLAKVDPHRSYAGLLHPSTEAADIPAALAEATRSFGTASRKRIILASPGESVSAQIGELPHGIIVSTVCYVTPSFDAVLMSQIATAGSGRFYFTNSAEKLPQLLANETRR